MARPKKNKHVRTAMCERFVTAMQILKLTPAETARALGYSNQTTITKVQRGEAFVDVERLYLLANLRSPEGRAIDLNWLITGIRREDRDF
jgi:transcriptional regulator with XRE-family HTH domain